MIKGVENCPICNGECEHRQCGRSCDGGFTYRSYIQCLDCGLRSPLFDTKKQAIEYWNGGIRESRMKSKHVDVCLGGEE